MGKKHTIGSFLFDYLYKQGVRHAFGIPGDFALPTFRWLQKSDIDLITMTHEPSIGFAADGYARVHGLGVACVTYCVGGLNMVNSIACAYAEKSPVLVISGGPSMADRRSDQLVHHKVKNFDTQRRVFEEVTCATAVLSDPHTAASEIIRVVEMIKQECRPGYIEIPYDLVDMPIKISAHKPAKEARKSDKEMLDVALAEAAAFINAAKKPVLIADIELHRHGLTEVAIKFAEKCNIPIAATLLSKGIINETHPLYIGVYSGGMSEEKCQNYVEQSDCIIMFGAFISDVFLGQYTAHLERKNTVLVTTEKTRVGLHSYENVLFEDFLKGLRKAPITAKRAFKNPNPFIPAKPLGVAERKAKLSAQNIFRIVSLNIDAGTTIVADTGDALLGTMGVRTSEHKHFFADAYYLSMGFAIPASIGAMVTQKKKERTIVIVGDGAFQMTGMELSTAAKYGLKPIVIVINNDGYGTQRHIIDGPFNNIHPWHYAEICDFLGYGHGVKVDTNGDFAHALETAFESNEMTVIEAVIPRDDCSIHLRRMGEALGRLRDVKKRKK